MTYSTTFPQSSTYLQGNQILRMDSRIEIRDSAQNVLQRFSLSDFGAIADNGEFNLTISLDSTTTPSFTFDETITGFTGNTPATDIDLLIISTTDTIFLHTADGSGTTRNPGGKGSVHEISEYLIWHTNSCPEIVLETAIDQRVLPFKIWLSPNSASADVSVYMAKFSTE